MYEFVCYCKSISKECCAYTNYLNYALERNIIDYERKLQLEGYFSTNYYYTSDPSLIDGSTICLKNPHTNVTFRSIEDDIVREFNNKFMCHFKD